MHSTWKLTRIGIGSAVKTGCAVLTVLGFIVGIIWGVIFALFSTVIGAALESEVPAVGGVAIVVFPVFTAIIYCILGAVLIPLATLIYNLAAGIVGGIELEMTVEREDNDVPDSFSYQQGSGLGI